MINGTQFITALGAEAVERALLLTRQADIIAAMSTEGLRGTVRHLHPSELAHLSHSSPIIVYMNIRSSCSSTSYRSESGCSTYAFVITFIGPSISYF